MAFVPGNLSVDRKGHENGVSRVFDYTHGTDTINDTRQAGYFPEEYFVGGDVIKVSAANGDYFGMWTGPSDGVITL